MSDTATATSTHASPRKLAALICGLLVTGSGQLLRGQYARGTRFLLASQAMWAIGVLLGLVIGPMALLLVVGCELPLRFVAVVDALRTPAATTLPSRGRFFLILFCLVVVTGIEKSLVREYVVEAFRVPSGSMIPAVLVDDRVFVDKRRSDVQRGDVIVFDYPVEPEKQLIKRVVAIGGDEISQVAGQWILNGKPLPTQPVDGACSYEDFDDQRAVWVTQLCRAQLETLGDRSFRVILRPNGEPGNFDAVRVPPGHLFVLGDNRDASNDSRYWGFVSTDAVKGKVTSVYYSRGKDGVRWDRIRIPIR